MDFLHKSFQEFFAAFFEQVSDPRYFVKLEEVLLFSCGILAMKCGKQVVALVQSLTNEVNGNEGSGLKVVLEAINECEGQKSDFQSWLANSFGTCLNLTDLNLYYNGMSEAGATSIADAVEGNKMLTNLDFSDNGMSEASATSIAEAIKVNKTLTNLNLCSCGINKTLTNLDLSDNSMSEDSATSIAEEIKVNKTLTNLNLSSNGISDAGTTSIVEAIKVN